MQRVLVRQLTALSVLSLLIAGCAAHSPAARQQRPTPLFPFALAGEDTRVRLAFGKSSIASAAPNDDEDDTNDDNSDSSAEEICSLQAGGCRILCTSAGSTLRLGPGDSPSLLDDNPMWQVQAADETSLGATLMRLYGVLFLIGGSVERLPDTLADYLDKPGAHEAEAVALARQLLRPGGATLPGRTPGGDFSVTVELTDAGREKLIDALVGDDGTGNRRVWLASHSVKRRGPHSRHLMRVLESKAPSRPLAVAWPKKGP